MKEGINLISGMQGQIAGRKHLVWIARVVTTIVLIGSGVLSFSLWSYRLIVSKQVEGEKQTARQLESRIASFSSREQRQQLIMNRYAAASKLLSGRVALGTRVRELIQLLPNGVTLTGLGLDDDKPIATVQLKSSTLAGFSAAIQEFGSNDFTDVTVSKLNRNQAGEFLIEVVVGGGQP